MQSNRHIWLFEEADDDDEDIWDLPNRSTRARMSYLPSAGRRLRLRHLLDATTR